MSTLFTDNICVNHLYHRLNVVVHNIIILLLSGDIFIRGRAGTRWGDEVMWQTNKNLNGTTVFLFIVLTRNQPYYIIPVK